MKPQPIADIVCNNIAVNEDSIIRSILIYYISNDAYNWIIENASTYGILEYEETIKRFRLEVMPNYNKEEVSKYISSMGL